MNPCAQEGCGPVRQGRNDRALAKTPNHGVPEGDGMTARGFAQLPKALLDRKDVGANTKLAYAFIVDAMRDKGVAWLGVRTIAKGIGCWPSTAQEAIDQIEEAGLLMVEHRGDGKVNKYFLPDQERTDSDNASAPETSTVPNKPSAPEFGTGVPEISTEPDRKSVPKKTRLIKKTYKRSKPTEEEVESIFQTYPRRVAKKAGLKAIEIALKEVPHAELLALTERFARSVNGTDKKYIPHPATWFKGERWTDLDAETESGFQQALKEVRNGQ